MLVYLNSTFNWRNNITSNNSNRYIHNMISPKEIDNKTKVLRQIILFLIHPWYPSWCSNFQILWTVKLRSKCDIWFTGVLWYDILISTIAIDFFYLTNSNYYIITNRHACASLRHGNKVMVMYFMMKTNPFLVQHLLA